MAEIDMNNLLPFEPLWDYMKSTLLSQDIVHADETELRVLKTDGKPTGKMARMWVFCSGKVVTDILGEYGNYLKTDGYSAYNFAEKAKHVGCIWLSKKDIAHCKEKISGLSAKKRKKRQF